ncbi:MAG: phosphotransferase [Polyangiaceae bacterium]|nr:phosphotransferase [Polyangiaceae bacterium]
MDTSTPAQPRPGVTRDVLELAIRRFAGPAAALLSARPLAGDRGDAELKHVGYGEPLLIRYRTAEGEREAVFRTMMPNWFGHDRRADRAALAILAADTYGRMPRHVQVLDVGALGGPEGAVSLGGAGELYLITTYAAGSLYAQDLAAIEARSSATLLDAARQHALCQYLVELHTPFDSWGSGSPGGALRPRPPLPEPAPELYTRAIRDLLGSGEGIFGIVDSYPPGGPVPRERLDALERRCLAFRHRLRGRERRLRRTHGDYHPYNVLFREGVDFTVLDASRGAAGDPADDVVAMSINYFFRGVLTPSCWARGMKPLWDAFWQTYLSATGDEELLSVAAPFIAWRALVLASPVWYPTVSPAARDAILAFAESALDSTSFDPASASRFIP